jgi:ribosomal protein L9
MKMVEMERKRSDEEHAVLLKRIAFLTEELEETKRQLRAKVTFVGKAFHACPRHQSAAQMPEYGSRVQNRICSARAVEQEL